MALPDYFTKAAIAEAEYRAGSRSRNGSKNLERRMAELEARVEALERRK